MFADNMYSYGNWRGNVLTEDLLHNAQTEKGKIRAAVIHKFANSPINERVTIVKSSDFIGMRIVKGIFGVGFLNDIFANKTVNLFGNPKLPHHFSFINDFAKAMLLVAFENDTYNTIWHVPNAPAITPFDWLRLFEQSTSLNIKHRTVPKLAIQLLGLFNPFIKELSELSYQFEYPYLIDSSKFIKRFGDISTKPEVIVQQTIEWYNLNNR